MHCNTKIVKKGVWKFFSHFFPRKQVQHDVRVAFCCRWLELNAIRRPSALVAEDAGHELFVGASEVAASKSVAYLAPHYIFRFDAVPTTPATTAEFDDWFSVQ